MAASPGPGNSSHVDGNQQFSIIGVAGTLGTSDAAGTADTVAISANPATGAMYVQDLSGASGTTNVLVVGGTLNAGTVTVGSISAVGQIHNAGTLAAGGNNIGDVDIATGTITSVSNLASGTLASLVSGTITGGTLGNLVSGTINALAAGTITGGTLGNLNAGTLTTLSSGTINYGTTIGSITANGQSIILNTTGIGAVAVGIANTYAATLQFEASIDGTNYVGIPVQKFGTSGNYNVTQTSESGGNTGQYFARVGGYRNFRVRSSAYTSGTATINLTGASPNQFLEPVVVWDAQPLAALDNIHLANLVAGVDSTGISAYILRTDSSGRLQTHPVSGTITAVGALESGTIQINPVPVPTTLTFGTLGTAGGSFFGTISAASGAGTKHYVTGVDVVIQSGTADVRVLAGSAIQGTGVLAAGQFPAGGGISNQIQPAFATGTNSELLYHFVGAGTAFIRVSYWKGT